MKGVATHTGPESCAVVRKDGGEALTGVRVGRVLSREKESQHRGAHAVRAAEGNTWCVDNARHAEAPRGQETPSMHGNTSHGTGRSRARLRWREL